MGSKGCMVGFFSHHKFSFFWVGKSVFNLYNRFLMEKKRSKFAWFQNCKLQIANCQISTVGSSKFSQIIFIEGYKMEFFKLSYLKKLTKSYFRWFSLWLHNHKIGKKEKKTLTLHGCTPTPFYMLMHSFSHIPCNSWLLKNAEVKEGQMIIFNF
jgi:hypothetical protein